MYVCYDRVVFTSYALLTYYLLLTFLFILNTAPTNDAFAALPEGTVESLLEADNIDALTDILTYHVVAAKVLSTELANGDVETLNGDSVTVNLDDGVKINDSNVITADIEACNGVIHVIDAVLLPPDAEEDVVALREAPTTSSDSGSATHGHLLALVIAFAAMFIV